MKQLVLQSFYSTHCFKTVNYGTLLAYVIANVQSDLTVPE